MGTIKEGFNDLLCATVTIENAVTSSRKGDDMGERQGFRGPMREGGRRNRIVGASEQ